jgi:NAD-dependent deacetylase
MTSEQPYPPGLLESLRAARHVVVLTGAGISAESGVPTFRDAQTGLWARYDPTELASPEAFTRDPRLVWEWYAWRRALVAQAQPNPGHYALVDLARRVPRFTLITQNVDNLHQAAGSTALIELHGNLQRSKCSREGTLVDEWADTGAVPPHCPACGALLRPDVVWFGESLPPQALFAAVTAARDCDFFFAVGTAAMVQPAASLPLEALRRGAVLVEINPDETPLTHAATHALTGPAGKILPALVAAAWPNG